MTLDDALVPAATSLASMNRLQLQAACVKLGLDSTPENELLRKQLREHEGYMQSHAHSSPATITTTTSITTTITTEETEQDSVAHLPAGDTDVAMEDALEVKTEESVVATIKVESEQEEEEQEQQQQEQDIAEEAEAQHEEMAVDEMSIKQEAMDEDVQESLPFHDPMLVEVKTEKDETKVVIKQEKDTSSGNTITIKQEKEEETIVTIKQEKVDDKSPGDDVKKEDSPVPIAQRRQLWEARAAAPSQQRSGLPLSKARINNQFTNVATRRANSTTTTPQVQKRRRTADGEDDMDVSMEDNSSPTPPSGTVRKLIGRFAGSSIDAPSSPVGKKRRVDLPTPKSSPGPGSSSSGSSFPSIPKFKRVVKIPVSSTRSGSSLYAMGNSAFRSGSGTVGVKRRAASDSANVTTDKTSPGSTPAILASTAGATPKKASKPVSAETINRLATPKKINTPASTAALSNVAPVPAPNFGASTSTAPSTATVTKARGPVLSTAARAAQRQKK
ncbi:hypothetical protein KI688_010246 [Linnemannia hyalina]|uniref:Uncharacterized protein n=1 Tax=Linnemannia hyalina TaxID=64524 RepID=A0A9P7Y112_9FUNG|nr:hypothetical protein KI688_010246 [Linnemannia hyalina]